MSFDKAYGSLAGVYDTFMDDIDYEGWVRWHAKVLEEHLGGVAGKYCVDAACGTGKIAIGLAKLGAKIVGVDISPEMLAQAGENARKAGVSVTFVLQDIRELRVGNRADAVVCACDVVNYLAGEGDAQKFFLQAREALRPGGLLVFDISSRHKLANVMGNGVFCDEREDMAYILKTDFNGAKSILNMDLALFIRDNKDRFIRKTERHTLKAYEKEELDGFLAESGFETVAHYAEIGFGGPGPESMRIHFVARKR